MVKSTTSTTLSQSNFMMHIIVTMVHLSYKVTHAHQGLVCHTLSRARVSPEASILIAWVATRTDSNPFLLLLLQQWLRGDGTM